MTRLKPVLALLPLLLAAPVHAEGGWCYADFQDNPKAPFALLASFTMELTARKNAGQVSEEDYKRTYGEIGAANEAFARGEPKAGCQKLEALEDEFKLLPRSKSLDNGQ